MSNIFEFLNSDDPVQALTLASVAHSLPAMYAFNGSPGVFDLWKDVTFRAVQANLVIRFGFDKAEVRAQINMIGQLIEAQEWAIDYYATQDKWFAAASRAQSTLASAAGQTIGSQSLEGSKGDMVHALLSYFHQLSSGDDTYRNKHGGVYLDDLDLTRLSLWVYTEYGIPVGYRAYDVRFPYNPAEKPLRFFDVGDVAVSLGLGYWTTQIGVSGKHGRFRLFLPGWLTSVGFPQLPNLRPMPQWSTGQVIHYENNTLLPSKYDEMEWYNGNPFAQGD